MNTLFFDYDVPDSCCAERLLHIPTYPRLVSTAAMVGEKMYGQIDKPTNRPITITLRCACAARFNDLMDSMKINIMHNYRNKLSCDKSVMYYREFRGKKQVLPALNGENGRLLVT